MNTMVPVKSNGATPSRFAPDEVDLIKRTICKGSTDDELRLFMYQAERTGLDPLARQIYAIKRWDNNLRREVMGIQTSIDGFRLIAERTGKYAGQVGPFWCGPNGEWVDAWLDAEPPSAAKVGIVRTDFKEPCWGVARFVSYAQKNKEGKLTKMWATMSDVMVAKCAEALALRKAFPQELSGLYTSDEMDQVAAAQPPAPRVAPKAAPLKLAAPVDHDPETGEIVEPKQVDENWARGSAPPAAPDPSAAPVSPPEAGAVEERSPPTVEEYVMRWHAIVERASSTAHGTQMGKQWNDERAMRNLMIWPDDDTFTALQMKVRKAVEFLKAGAA